MLCAITPQSTLRNQIIKDHGLLHRFFLHFPNCFPSTVDIKTRISKEMSSKVQWDSLNQLKCSLQILECFLVFINEFNVQNFLQNNISKWTHIFEHRLRKLTQKSIVKLAGTWDVSQVAVAYLEWFVEKDNNLTILSCIAIQGFISI